MVKENSSTFLFFGPDSYLKEKAIKNLSASAEEPDYKVFYGQGLDSDEFLDYVRTAPFLAAKRIAVVRDLERISEEFRTRLTAYIKNPAKTTCLILEARDSVVLKDYEELSGHINIKRFDELKAAELASWIRQFLSSRGKSIEPDAIDILVELQGDDLLCLSQELEKIATFSGERDRITSGDIEALVGKGLIGSAFEIVDNVEKGRLSNSLKTVSDLLMAGKRPHEMVGILCWHFKRILKARKLRLKGETDSHIARVLNIRGRYHNEFFRQVGAFNFDAIRSKLEILLEADLDIKRTRFDPALILEFAIIRLCLSGA